MIHIILFPGGGWLYTDWLSKLNEEQKSWTDNYISNFFSNNNYQFLFYLHILGDQTYIDHRTFGSLKRSERIS